MKDWTLITIQGSLNMINYEVIKTMEFDDMVNFLLRIEVNVYNGLGVDVTNEMVDYLKSGIYDMLVEEFPCYLGVVS